MSFRVGITGGMGSGKSTAAAIFEILGVPVYRADDAAKRLMNEDPVLKSQLIKSFGEGTYTDGLLNRAYLSAAVFNDAGKLAVLNSFVHPATINDAENWMRHQTAPYALKEAAIIFESGSHRYLDYVIGVYAPLALRVQRSMRRTRQTREEIIARIDQQMDDSIKMKLCDSVLINDEQQALIPQVMRIHAELTALAERPIKSARP